MGCAGESSLQMPLLLALQRRCFHLFSYSGESSPYACAVDALVAEMGAVEAAWARDVYAAAPDFGFSTEATTSGVGSDNGVGSGESSACDACDAAGGCSYDANDGASAGDAASAWPPAWRTAVPQGDVDPERQGLVDRQRRLLVDWSPRAGSSIAAAAFYRGMG